MQPLRADARRNRELIVGAAARLFAESGPEVAMEEVARRAGVGVGTLYRRFPDREALVSAVAYDSFHRVVDQARRALDEPGGWEPLRGFIRRSVADFRFATWLSLWFTRAWDALCADPEHEELRREFMGLLDRLVRRAQDEGTLRPDVSAGDLALLLVLVLRPLPGPPALAADTAERCIAVVLDGLQAVPTDPLPGRPVEIDDLRRPGAER